MILEFVLITIALSLLSIIANVWVTYVYMKNEDLQKHPSTILACISVFEIALSHHSIALAMETNLSIKGHGPHHVIQVLSLFSLSLEDSKSVTCAINQMLFAGSATGVLCYNMFLCADLIITLRNPLISGKQRMKIYHSIAFLLISLSMAYNVWWNLDYEECELSALDYIYEIWNNGMLTVVYFGYISTATISVIYSLYKLCTKGQYINSATRGYLTKHIKYIIVLSFIWTWCACNFWLDFKFKSLPTFRSDKTWVLTISLVLINLSGFIQALLRNWEKAFWVKSKELCRRKHTSKVSSSISVDVFSSIVFNKDFKETDDMWNMPTSFIMQESFKTQTTLCILFGVYEVLRTEGMNRYSIELSKANTKEHTKHKIYFNNSEYKISIIDFYSFPYFIVIEHCPKIFSELRQLESLDLKEILHSLHPENNKLTLLSLHQELGGSGSLFIFTENQKVAIKIITLKEREFLQQKLLYLYYRHIESEPSSLLNRLLGLFTIKIPGLAPLDIVISPGLVDCNVDKFYDLKGSTYNRLSHRPDESSFKGPFKDSDFINEKSGFPLHPILRKRVLSNIRNDAKFLMENGIMDYSLIVCLLKSEAEKTYPSPDLKTWYRFGIIDFLGEYSFKRKAEYYVKLIRLGKRIKMCSVMNPRSYYNRFLCFLSASVFIKD